MSENYFDSKEFKELLQRFEKSERECSSEYFDSDQLMDIAEYYDMLGNVNRTRQIVEKAIHTFPDSAYPKIFKARMALICDNDSELARDIASQISDTTDMEYIYLIAEILLYDKQVEKADSYLEKNYADMDEDISSDFVIDVATLFADYEIAEQAEKWLLRSTEIQAEDYQDTLGRIELLKGNYEKSIEIFNQLIDRDPYSIDYWNHLSTAQYKLGNIPASLQSCGFALAINPSNPDATLMQANIYLQTGDFAQAANIYHKYSQLRPQEETGFLYEAVSMSNLNQHAKALELYRQAELRCKKSGETLRDIYHNMAFTLSNLKRQDEAISYANKILEVSPNDRYETAILRGHIYLECGSTDMARDAFIEAINLSDGTPTVFLHIAISASDNGYIEYAYQCLQVMFALAPPTWKDGYAYLAMCCKEMGKEKEYLQALQTACQLNPDEARNVFEYYFPENVNPEDYYKYAIRQNHAQ